jgi:hypothetical protein
MNRGYSLPQGCKDLIDVLKLKAQALKPAGRHDCIDVSKLKQDSHGSLKVKPPFCGLTLKWQPPRHPAALLPPVIGEIVVSTPASIFQLAELLGQKPFRVVADLVQFGIFAGVTQLLYFETISRIARKYGFIARQSA